MSSAADVVAPQEPPEPAQMTLATGHETATDTSAPADSGSSSSSTTTTTATTTALNTLMTGSSRRGGSAQKKHQRILWDSDAATRDGKTSIGILLEWLATPGNYDRWRDGKSQFGETREALCSQIKAEMVRHGIGHRENANIRTQMSELERAYDNAVLWLLKNGYDGKLPDPATLAAAAAASPTDAAQPNSSANNVGSSVETQVLRTCRYFHTLDPIMRKASAARLAFAGAAPVAASSTPAAPQSSAAASPAAATATPQRPRARPRAPLRVPKTHTQQDASDDKTEQHQQQQHQPGDWDVSGGNGRDNSESARPSASSKVPSEHAPSRATSSSAAAAWTAHGVRRLGSSSTTGNDAPTMAALATHAAAAEPRQYESTPVHQHQQQKRKAPSSTLWDSPSSSTAASYSSAAAAAPSGPAAPVLPPALTAGAHSQSLPLLVSSRTPAAAAAATTDPSAYETQQRLLFEAAREERECKRLRMDEERSRLECERLRLEIQATRLRLQVERALARKQLAAAELTDAEIAAALEV